MEKKQTTKRLAKRYFGSEAKEYDLSRVKDLRDKDVFLKELKIIKDLLKTCKKGKLFDVACGTGRVFKVYDGFKIYGIDISGDMLKQAIKRFPNAKLKVSDAENIQYPDNFFNVVITSRFIMHTPEYRKIIKEMARVTKIGGHLIVDFPNKHSLTYFPTKIKILLGKSRTGYFNLFTFREIHQIAEENKLKIVDIKSKVFFPPRILPKQFHKIVKLLNNLLNNALPRLSTPIIIKFKKLG